MAKLVLRIDTDKIGLWYEEHALRRHESFNSRAKAYVIGTGAQLL